MPTSYLRAWRDGQYTMQHRVVMEGVLGRRLLHSEHVHHINGDKRDNRPENLQVMSPSAHASLHSPQVLPSEKVCPVCGVTFTPHPTKRRRAKTCGAVCGRVLTSQRQRLLSPEQIAEVLALRAAGATQWAIAHRFNTTQATIWGYLKRAKCA